MRLDLLHLDAEITACHQWRGRFGAIHPTTVLLGTGQHGGCENLLKDLRDLLGVHSDKRSSGRQSPLEPGCRREREKSPPHQTLAMQMSFSYSSIGGTMAVIHGGALIRYRVLGKACWLRGTESKVPPMSFHLAAAPPSSLIIHYCHLVPLKRRRHMFREDCSLNHGGHERTAYMGHVRPPRWRLPHAFKLSLCALCESRPTKSFKKHEQCTKESWTWAYRLLSFIWEEPYKSHRPQQRIDTAPEREC